MPKRLDLSKPLRIHFIGIGGISMSALALILLQRGWQVSGSDLKQSAQTDKLIQHGATVYIGHNAAHIEGAKYVVYTSAIPPDNVELVAAHKNQIPVFTRAELLGALMAEAKCGIAVAGSHGKTTTTAMIGLMLTHARLEPTVLVGGDLEAIHGNVKIGNGGYLVAEACEYYDNFLLLKPRIGVITNIDADHLDYFGNLEGVKQAFRRFAQLIPASGHLVAFNDDANVRNILPGLKCQVVTYGLHEGADWQAVNIGLLPGGSNFDVLYKGRLLTKVSLRVPGLHNILNALAAIATGHIVGLSMEDIVGSFAYFQGTHRRFELQGTYHGALIYDDYAHHPNEIKATLAAARTFAPQRLISVFQPHTYTRTEALLEEFAEAFAEADLVLLVDIYAAREQNTSGITSAHLADQMQKRHPQAYYAGSIRNAAAYLRRRLRKGDLLLTMGAGDVYRVAHLLLGKEPDAEPKGPASIALN
ncbi:MAG: UDP-N-acetylmuramate--L-alanine ligase [Firmicutes bacterium]|nr:UDP-N-acetylmuramate--L-alanine ligase [Bacillota bacterium]